MARRRKNIQKHENGIMELVEFQFDSGSTNEIVLVESDLVDVPGVPPRLHGNRKSKKKFKEPVNEIVLVEEEIDSTIKQFEKLTTYDKETYVKKRKAKSGKENQIELTEG